MVIRAFSGRRFEKKTVYLLVYCRERHLRGAEGKFECGDYLVRFRLFVEECVCVCICVLALKVFSWKDVWVNAALLDSRSLGIIHSCVCVHVHVTDAHSYYTHI